MEITERFWEKGTKIRSYKATETHEFLGIHTAPEGGDKVQLSMTKEKVKKWTETKNILDL